MEDIDDDTFLRKTGHELIDDIHQKAEEIEDRSLESTKRSLKHLAGSEIVGLTSAEELVRNRESIKNVSVSLDGIAKDLKSSQRHVSSISSLFANLKNSLFKKKKNKECSKSVDEEVGDIDDGDKIDAYLMKKQKNNFSYSFPWTDDNKNMTSLQGRVLTGDLTSSNNPFKTGAIDDNIDTISSSVNRLKGLATAMGDELECQNTDLELIKDKTTDIQIKMDAQGRLIEKMIK